MEITRTIRPPTSIFLEFIPMVYKKKDLPLEEVNYSFIKKYEYFLHTERNPAHRMAP
jgi:hypothetical protein